MQGMPTPAKGVEVASYRTYVEAQAAVDHLSDEQFDVRGLCIVGTDLQLVERITGRLTWGKVLWNGMLSGLWLGLFVAILFALWTPNELLPIMLVGLGMGAVFGMTLSAVPYALRRGARDFTSATQVVAARYAVLAQDGVEEFRRALQNTPGNLTRVERPKPVEDLSKPTAFGSRPDEKPKYGVRLSQQSPQGSAVDQAGRPVPGQQGMPQGDPTAQGRPAPRHSAPAAPGAMNQPPVRQGGGPLPMGRHTAPRAPEPVEKNEVGEAAAETQAQEAQQPQSQPEPKDEQN